MWICANKGFISVVAIAGEPDHLSVRGRFRGDIERLFPDADVIESEKTLYRYRAIVSRSAFNEVLGRLATDIDYTNFKDSVESDELHRMYFDFWVVAHHAQAKTPEPSG